MHAIVRGMERILHKEISSYSEFSVLVRTNPIVEVSAEVYAGKNNVWRVRFRAHGSGLNFFCDENIPSEGDPLRYAAERLSAIEKGIEENPPMVSTGRLPNIILAYNGLILDQRI